MKFFLTIFAWIFSWGIVKGQAPSDHIVGKWISSQGNVVVNVLKEFGSFKARVVWFNDSDDKTKPMDIRTDEQNPDISLRSRKIIGLEVLKNLTYNGKTNRWEHGKIYDVSSGRVWSSSVWITNEGFLKVRGYWHFEFLGQTMTFRRL